MSPEKRGSIIVVDSHISFSDMGWLRRTHMLKVISSSNPNKGITYAIQIEEKSIACCQNLHRSWYLVPHIMSNYIYSAMTSCYKLERERERSPRSYLRAHMWTQNGFTKHGIHVRRGPGRVVCWMRVVY